MFGAFSEDPAGRQPAGTAGSESFHDWLRSIFDRSNSYGPLGFVMYLQTQLRAHVWDGSLLGVPEALLQVPVGFYYRTDSGVDGSLTVAQLAAIQRENWIKIQNDFAAVVSALRSGG